MGNCHRRTRPPTPVITFQQPQTTQGGCNRHTLYELVVQKVNSPGTASAFTPVTPGDNIKRPTLRIPPEQTT